MHYRSFILLLCLCAFVVLSVIGCQGGNDGIFSTPATQITDPVDQETEPVVEPVTGFPGFPAGDIADPAAPRIVAAQDNILDGSESYARHGGATASGADLIMDASSSPAVWGLWRWGVFTGPVVPLTLELDVDAGGGEYWLAVSYYRNSNWRIFGPLTDSAYTHTYDIGINHVSQTSGYTYVALLAAPGNTLTVHSLNMTADNDVEAPAIPTGLVASTIQGTRIELSWDANSETDLDGYNIFSGPADNFDINGSSVEEEGSVSAGTTSFWVENLTGDTEYHFRITAFDALGNESGPSATVNPTTTTPSQDPTNLHTTGVGSTTAGIAWDEPLAGTPLGYEIYTGPTEDFEVGDTGVVKQNTTLVYLRTFTISGLTGLTEYHCRVRAYYPGGPSALSNTTSFTTVENAAPKPSFTVSPQFVESGETILFNPASTTDEDTPPEELIFKWDFQNDGVNDYETTGPEIVSYVYHVRGPMTVKMTVNDGSDYSTTRDFVISFNYAYYPREPSTGAPGEIIAIDTDPTNSRIAVLMTAGALTLVRYYDGTSWSEFDASNIDCLFYADVALNPTGFSVLVAKSNDTASSWAVYDNNLTNWSKRIEETIEREFAVTRYLDIDANNRISVGVMEGYNTGDPTVTSHYLLYIWHEKADGTFVTDNAILVDNYFEVFDVQRNETTSYFIYSRNGSLHEWEVTDSSDSDTTIQSYTGRCNLLTTSLDPDNDTQVSYAFTTNTPRVYYGDNFGTANGSSQYRAVSLAPDALLGCGLAPDNTGLVYWCDEQSDATQRLVFYNSTGGAETVIAGGPGLVADGCGQYFDDGSNTGVYTCAQETRDGELFGRFMDGTSITSSEIVFTPDNADDQVLGHHIPLVFPDDSVLVIDEMNFGSARSSAASSIEGPFSDFVYGTDNWCQPVTACVTGTGHEFFIATYRNMLTDPVLDINLYTQGTSTGTTEATLASTSLPQLIYHPVSGEVLLITADSAATSLQARTWNGVTWSAPTSLYSGADTIECYAIAPKGTADWGLAFVDTAENTQLIETSSGSWGSAGVISTETINGASGIHLAYHSDGTLAVAVERWVVQAGIYLGIGPDGSSLTWERIATSSGSECRSIWIDFYNPSPIVFYYLRKTPLRNSRVEVVEDYDGTWTVTELPDQLHGNPVSYNMDSNGNVIIAGYNMSADPRFSAIGILKN